MWKQILFCLSVLTYCFVYPYWLIVLSIRIDLLFCLSVLTYCFVYPYWLIVLSIRIDLLFCLSVLTYCFVYPYWLIVLSIRIDLLFCLSVLTYCFVTILKVALSTITIILSLYVLFGVHYLRQTVHKFKFCALIVY